MKDTKQDQDPDPKKTIPDPQHCIKECSITVVICYCCNALMPIRISHTVLKITEKFEKCSL